MCALSQLIAVVALNFRTIPARLTSSLVAVVVGAVWLGLYFRSEHAYLHVRWSDWRPQLPTWTSMLKVGLPAGA